MKEFLLRLFFGRQPIIEFKDVKFQSTNYKKNEKAARRRS